MGTLFNQSPRETRTVYNEDIANFLLEMQRISEQTDLTIDQVLKAAEIKELQRRNKIIVDNGDIFDEQMMGFGEIARDLIIAFKK